MSNADKVDECPHDRLGYEDCEECAEENVANYIALRVLKQPTVLASVVLADIRAGKMHEVSPEEHEQNIRSWLAKLSPEARAGMLAAGVLPRRP